MLLLANAAMVFTALTVVRVEIGNAAAVAICGGSFGLLLLSAYPVHLAIGGDEWLNCVVDQYPMWVGLCLGLCGGHDAPTLVANSESIMLAVMWVLVPRWSDGHV